MTFQYSILEKIKVVINESCSIRTTTAHTRPTINGISRPLVSSDATFDTMGSSIGARLRTCAEEDNEDSLVTDRLRLDSLFFQIGASLCYNRTTKELDIVD